MDDSKVWWRSKTLWGVLVTLIGTILKSRGIDISGETAAITDLVGTIAEVSGGALAIWGRVTAKTALTARAR